MPSGCGEGKGGAGVGSPRRVGSVRPGGGAACGVGRTDTAEVGLTARGGIGRVIEGLRGWSRELQMVRASLQNVETLSGKRDTLSCEEWQDQKRCSSPLT